MMSDELYAELNKLRDEYRGKMNRSAEAAQAAAQTEDMDVVSMCSTESERYREAFHALNRAIRIIEDSTADELAAQSKRTSGLGKGAALSPASNSVTPNEFERAAGR